MSKFSGNEARRKQRLTPRREPSGKLQREPQEERTAEIVAIVLAQPHRRGSDDDRRHTPLGRLILDGKVKAAGVTPDELWRASLEYGQAFANMRRVWDSRRPWAVSEGRIPPDLSEKQRADYERAWGDCSRALRDAGVMAQKAVEFLLQDAGPDDEERCYGFHITHGAGLGLLALARHFKIV
jgi:hypothetical protein